MGVMNEQAGFEYMREALRLAAKGAGWVAPNPMVGAVIVKEGQVVGKGYHRRFGGPHAEVEALAQCRKGQVDVRGATMYVTLEPCCHVGKTGPCTEAVIEAGIGRVEIATLDVFAAVSGKGAQRLREAGLDVTVGLCEAEARKLNGGFIMLQQSHRPLVILKWAQSEDGRLAWPIQAKGEGSGEASRWISNEKSRRHAHRLRSRCTAVLVGIGTVLADDPLLTVRLKGRHFQPMRVVLDSDLRIPEQCKLVQTATSWRLVVFASREAVAEQQEKVGALYELGCDIVPVASGPGGLDVGEVVRGLGERGVTELLVEGGAKVLRSFYEASLADKVVAYVAPVRIGGGAEVARVDFLADQDSWRCVRRRRLAGDLLIEACLSD